jgi:hypothetical protein
MPIEVPKFMPDQGGGGGNLIVEPGDLVGNYDYVPDIESMAAPNNADIEQKLQSLLLTLTNPAIVQGLMSEGVKPKYKELIVRAIEATNVVRDAEAYFEDIQNQMGGGMPNVPGQVNPGGVTSPEAGIPSQGAMPGSGMAGGAVAPAGIPNQISSGGPAQVPAGY